jgi:hypothetical protein
MSSSSLIRLGGLATMLAGALLIIGTIPILMGVIGSDLTKFAQEATTGTYALLTRLGVLATILLQGGLVALHSYRSEAMGILGLVGFVAAFLGTAMALGYAWADAFVVPAVAEIAPGQLDSIYNIGTWGGARFLTRVLFGLGWFLFGLAAFFAAQNHPSWMWGVIMAGGLISLVPIPGSTLVISVGLVLAGYVLLASRAESDQQPSRVR